MLGLLELGLLSAEHVRSSCLSCLHRWKSTVAGCGVEGRLAVVCEEAVGEEDDGAMSATEDVGRWPLVGWLVGVLQQPSLAAFRSVHGLRRGLE